MTPTRTIALIHNDYYQHRERERHESRNKKSHHKKYSQERRRKMLSKKPLPKPRSIEEIIDLSKIKRKENKTKYKRGLKRRGRQKVKMYNPFSASDDTEVGERMNPWSLKGEHHKKQSIQQL